MIAFNHNQTEKVITLTFTGRMDTLAATEVNTLIENEPIVQNRQPDESIVFDLKDVDYIASSFIRICVSQARLAGQGRFSIANCQPMVRKTFKISGLDEVLNIT